MLTGSHTMTPDPCQTLKHRANAHALQCKALSRHFKAVGFGTFGISEQGERQDRNPQTGGTITIAVFRRAKFTAVRVVRDALSGG